MESLKFLAPALAVVALLFAFYKIAFVSKQDAGTERMKEIAAAINDGAKAFLFAEYKILAIFVVVLFIAIGLGLGSWITALCFLFGALFSILAGYIGMNVATKANVRTANAARTSGMNKALSIAFSGGSVMGMCVVGLGLLGASVLFLIFEDTNVLFGFSLGASSIALFARVGGGIYTKAADVGADLVGKVEAGIPEDDPRNPAVIADNVGDNVGDVAGMGADLFESYVGAIISAMTLGAVVVAEFGDLSVIFPLVIAACGILASVIATFFVRGKEGSNPHKALKMGSYVSALLVVIAAIILSKVMLGSYGPAIAIVAGLVVGLVIGIVTEVYTSGDYKFVKKIAQQSETGSATTIISGTAVGMMSTWVPVILICVGIFLAYKFAGLYGIALAAVGMLSTTGITVAVDAYGPIADNAGGIAEMSGLDHSVREITDKLDAVGNTTAAMGKGFAIGSAALTALALFVSFTQATGLTADQVALTSPTVVIGLLIGGMLPFVFSAMTMDSVSKAAYSMIEEVRRQFREIPGIMEGKAKPDYKTCVAISTTAALKEMLVPGIMAVVAPLAVGLILGSTALAGLLAGSLVSGVMMAMFMSNAGGAWDNAKKYIEEGHHGGKGSDAHKAAVVGDTVGDPFKDTSGPSINILIKLMTVVSTVFAAIFTANGLF
ncbi:MAG: sodium-translocating pyrophosphatase [Firmicutes bacterium CAG:24053_14]|jgi:K(+)-stimulated pyrophosphate-energized sodium pump|nr:MAG: sodium-translocating pyrophosphatase [Firmicutes bacterium CAG:24053_14]